nr:hypothetical protein [Aquihabitans sp. G128]
MKPGSNFENVGIDPDHEVAGGLVDRLPERFALAMALAEVGEHGAGVDHAGAGGGGHRRGGVGGVVVDDHHLVDQRCAVDQRRPDGGHHRADGGLLVAGRQADRDGQARAGLGRQQAGHREGAGGVRRQPPSAHGRHRHGFVEREQDGHLLRVGQGGGPFIEVQAHAGTVRKRRDDAISPP